VFGKHQGGEDIKDKKTITGINGPAVEQEGACRVITRGQGKDKKDDNDIPLGSLEKIIGQGLKGGIFKAPEHFFSYDKHLPHKGNNYPVNNKVEKDGYPADLPQTQSVIGKFYGKNAGTKGKNNTENAVSLKHGRNPVIAQFLQKGPQKERQPIERNILKPERDVGIADDLVDNRISTEEINAYRDRKKTVIEIVPFLPPHIEKQKIVKPHKNVHGGTDKGALIQGLDRRDSVIIDIIRGHVEKPGGTVRGGTDDPQT
jgi:hypothetical protein